MLFSNLLPRKTVDSVIESFTKAIGDLASVEARHVDDATRAVDDIEDAIARRDNANEQASRARAIRQKLTKLVEG